MADEPLRNEQGLAVGDIDPATNRPVVAIIASNKPRGDRALDFQERKADQAQGLNERQFAFHQLDSDRARTLNEHKSALDEVNNYYGLAKDLAMQETEMQRKIDAANFLSAAKDLKPGVTFDTDVAKLHAAYPHAAGDEAVKEWHSVMLPAQSNFDQANKAAVVNQREAEIKGVVPGDTMTRNLIAQGLLTDENLTYGDDPKKHVFNPDGTYDHVKAANIAAYNQDHGVFSAKGAAQEISEARRFISNPGVLKIIEDESHPAYEPTRQYYATQMAKLNAWDKEHGAPAASTTALPSETPASSNKPKVVIQGGHTYTLQPDGTYKP